MRYSYTIKHSDESLDNHETTRPAALMHVLFPNVRLIIQRDHSQMRERIIYPQIGAWYHN